jgi:hypothetical protein
MGHFFVTLGICGLYSFWDWEWGLWRPGIMLL